ncbi:MAG: serine protease [Armatimonadota bacterium]|nr:serine protease [Armatimonadota bacterium]MDW8142652.1 serine protease [Armatimonadota bacterium]
MRLLILVLNSLLLGVMVMAVPDLRDQLEKVLEASVQIVGERTIPVGDFDVGLKVMGSGTVIKKNGRTFIVTAAHVVDFLKDTVAYIDEEDGREKKKVIYKDAWVIKEKVKNGRKVAENRILVKVLFSSRMEEEGGDDIAVLEAYDDEELRHGVEPLPKGVDLWVGQRCWHVGSLLGKLVNSLAEGNIAALGRIIEDKPFHQIAGSAMPGSSGGGVFVEHNGKIYYAGMITRGIGETVNFFVPIERMRSALKEAPEGVREVLE